MKNIEKENIIGWRILKGIEKNGKNLGIYGRKHGWERELDERSESIFCTFKYVLAWCERSRPCSS